MTSQLEAMRSGKDELQSMYDALEESKLGLHRETASLTWRLQIARTEEERLSAERKHWLGEYGTVKAEKEDLDAAHVALEAKKCDLDAVNSEVASQLEPIRSGKAEIQDTYDA